MKKVKIFTLFFMFFCGIVSAQSADKVTKMIEAETVTLGDVAYFAASYFDLIDDNAENSEALIALEERVQYLKISNTEKLTYDDLAYFCTQTWNIKGGIMLMLTNSPRYAFRELQAKGYISNSIYPNDAINGVEALTIMTSCINYTEEKDVK